MRGFLARAGHLLGRLAVSLGYGGGVEPAGPPLVCFETRPASFEAFTEPALFAGDLQAFIPGFEMCAFLLNVETSPMVFAGEMNAFVPLIEMRADGCHTGTEPEAC